MNIFLSHRQRLARAHPDALFVLTANDAMQLSGDMSAPFLQDSLFWYLTGINEPGWRLICDTKQGKSWLVRPDISDIKRVFDGETATDAIAKASGIDHVVSAEEGDELLQKLAKRHVEVLTPGRDPHEKYYEFSMNPAPARLRRQLKKHFASVGDCRHELTMMKAIKIPEEIERIQRAVDVTTEVFKAVKRKLGDLRYEYEIEAEFGYAFRRAGGYDHAYEPIVAGGERACTLHYVANDQPLPKDGLVLLDIGARIDGYAADITRTYAIGTPSEREMAVHQAVQRAHDDIIALLKPDLRVKDYLRQVDDIMKRELKGLGLLKTKADYRKYFPHAVSHGLGIDVHDSLGGPETFATGMVITVEPGIYIPEEGIGVRIEDDILITEDGHRNLSGDLPRGV